MCIYSLNVKHKYATIPNHLKSQTASYNIFRILEKKIFLPSILFEKPMNFYINLNLLLAYFIKIN